MERKHRWVVAIGLVAMVLTVWFLRPMHSRGLVNKEKARYMHCLDCGKEWPFDARRFEGGCPRCGTKANLIPTEAAVLKDGATSLPNPYGKMIAPLLVEGNILLAVILYLNLPKRAPKESQKQFRTRCHQCHQKISYPQEKIGWRGRCPRCKTVVAFPAGTPVNADEEEGP